ncbi:MAG TPA: hypothetical protein VHS29_01070, partial [Candidatus Acidoferrales bacterium]|nr:hypothetical protein [Candidatus Acidoferrales bacterium]
SLITGGLLTNEKGRGRNLLVGGALYKVGHVSNDAYATLALLFSGAVAMSIILSINFAQKMHE